MEDRTKPVIHVITDKPPSKPSPLLEYNTPHHADEAQWKKLLQDNVINKYRLSIKHQQFQHQHRRDLIKYILLPPLKYLHIPTPKQPTRHDEY